MAGFLTTALALVALLVPASAAAQRTTVPPGQSEADQYFETVPDGKGDSSLDTGGEPADVLSQQELEELEALGADGAAAAQIAAATAPDGGDSPGSRTGEDASAGAGADGSGADGGPVAVGATLAADPARDGLGWLLWLLMLAAAAALVAYAVMRRRTRHR